MSSAATTGFPEYRVISDLNRECLPSSERDPDRKIAWMNAICLSILGIGILMTKEPAQMAFVPEVYDPPQEIQILEPQTLPPEEIRELKPEEMTDLPEVAPAEVVVVALDPSKVLFAVPVINATVASADLRQVSAPARLVVPPKAPSGPVLLRFGKNEYGDFPPPQTYPPEALARREVGSVILILKAGPDGGPPEEVTIEKSSGSSYLDIAARDWVRSKWRFFPGKAGLYRREFEYTLPGVGK
jgi:TonB family protein